MKQGYVRLTITDFEADGDFALKLHFGRGSWGSYIWLAGDEVKQLEAVLVSLETISGGEVSGQEKSLIWRHTRSIMPRTSLTGYPAALAKKNH